jgi:hypothetical protein
VEAIRAYAAGHEGRLPTALTDITDLPVPQDPATGQPFHYALTGGKAMLIAPPPPGERASQLTTMRIELTMAPAK